MSMVVKMDLSRLDLETLRDSLKASIDAHENVVRRFDRRGWDPKELAQLNQACDRQRAMLARVEEAIKRSAGVVPS